MGDAGLVPRRVARDGTPRCGMCTLDYRTAQVQSYTLDDSARRCMFQAVKHEQVIARLRAACAKAGTVSLWASTHRINRTHVQNVMAGRRAISPNVLCALGIRANPQTYSLKGKPNGKSKNRR